jgi:hypothetical protein
LGGKVVTIILWCLAGLSLFLGFVSWAGATLAFFTFATVAVLRHMGTDGLKTFWARSGWTKAICFVWVFLLIFGPLYAEPFIRIYGAHFTNNWKRDMQPEKIYYIWSVEVSGFEEDQELVKRWHPGREDNVDNKKMMLAAAYLLGIEKDVLAPFDPRELKPGQTFTLIVFESIKVKKIFPPKDPKDEPVERKVSQMRVTFITPANLAKKTSDKKIDKPRSGKGGGVVVGRSDFNRYVADLSSLEDSVFDFISKGLKSSLESKGDQVDREAVDAYAEQKDKDNN